MIEGIVKRKKKKTVFMLCTTNKLEKIYLKQYLVNKIIIVAAISDINFFFSLPLLSMS